MTATTAAQAAYIVAGLLFILSLASLSKHETAKSGNTFGMAGMAIALVATVGLAAARRHLRGRYRADGDRRGHRCRDRDSARPDCGHDRHARADRAAAQLRRSGRGAGRLGRLPGRGGQERSARGRRIAAAHPPRRGVHRRVHRRGHLHRFDRGVPQAVGAHQVASAHAARAQLPQRRRARGVRRPHHCLRHPDRTCGC